MTLPAAVGSWMGRLAPRTLGTRLALTYSGMAVLIVTILGWSLVVTIENFSVSRMQSDLQEETILVGDVLTPLLLDGADRTTVAAASERIGNALGARVTVIAADGRVIVDSETDATTMENHAGRPEIEEALQTGVGSSVRPSPTLDVPYFYVARSIADGTAVVRLSMPLSTIDSLLSDVQRQVIAAALAAGALMTGAGLFVARRIATALEEVRRQAVAIASGRLDVFVEPAPTRELGDLGRAFNTMTETLRGTLTELERARARLEATLADLSDGVVITDERGHIVLANDSALVLLVAEGTVTGQPFVEVARDHELADLVTQALTTPDVASEGIIHHGRSGRILQAAARRLDAAGERIGVIVLRDLTELRRLEGVRRDFVANVSHELRTPLTSIRALVETLEAGALDDPEVSGEFLHRIVSEVDRLALLVDELLDLARLESGRVRLDLAPIEPSMALERASQRLAPQTERAGLRVHIDVPEGLSAVTGDQDRIDQVLLNLVHNAIKFTPSGGSITLSATPAGDSVEFQVRDTGVGVDPEDMPRLFERFYKVDRARRSLGTGLGLAIAKHIVQAHGGAIWAEANQPTGSVFIFRLPVAGPDEANLPYAHEGDGWASALKRDAV